MNELFNDYWKSIRIFMCSNTDWENKMTKRFKFNGWTNCIEYNEESILLDSCGEKIEKLLNESYEENERFKFILQEAIRTERTDIGKNVLKQLADNLGVEY